MPIEPPWHLIERQHGFSKNELQKAGPSGASFLDQGIFKPTAVNVRLVCPECGGRCSDATPSPDNQKWRVYCGKFGVWNDVSAHQLEHYKTCMKTLLNCMAEASGARRDANTELIPEILYSIGRFPDQEFPPSFFTPGALDPAAIDLIISRLANFRRAVVFCLGDVSALAGRSSGISFLPVADAFSLNEKFRIVWDKKLVTNAISSTRPGAMSKTKRDWKPIVRKLHHDRKRAGTSLDEVTKEADALATILSQNAEHMGCRAVSASSIYNELFRGK